MHQGELAHSDEGEKEWVQVEKSESSVQIKSCEFCDRPNFDQIPISSLILRVIVKTLPSLDRITSLLGSTRE